MMFSLFDFEPDPSGYVDEYRFVPLTPRLAAVLSGMIAGRGFDSLSEARELEELGYVSDLAVVFGGNVSFQITPKGMAYEQEYETYRERRDAWADARRREERARFAQSAFVATFSALAGAVIGAATTLAAVR